MPKYGAAGNNWQRSSGYVASMLHVAAGKQEQPLKTLGKI
jgi:hypothetical protein